MKDIRSDVEFIYNNFGNLLLVDENKTIDPNSLEIGYCFKYDNVYSVFIAKTGDLRNDLCVKLHEYGHIYLGHLDGIHEEVDSMILRAINDNRDQLVEYINRECGIDFADLLLDKVIDDPVLNHSLHNIAMDMEVNSKILNLSDIEYQEKTLSDLMPKYEEEFLKYCKDHTDDQQKKDEIQKALDELSKQTKVKLIHPSRYHNPDGSPFPDELSYTDYILKIILNLDQFVKMMVSISQGGNGDTSDVSMDDVKNSLNGGVGQSGMDAFDKLMNNSGVSGNPSDSDSSSGKGQGSNDTVNKTDSPYKGSRDKGTDSNGTGDGSDGKGSDKKNDHGTDSRKDADKKRELGNIRSAGGKGCSNSGSPDATRLVEYEDEIEMELDRVFKVYKSHVIKRDFMRDVTYKYNRGILRGVISPSYRQKITISDEPKIVYIIDISGSMDTRLVDRVLRTISMKMKKIGRGLKYDIITWSTGLGEHIRDIDPRKSVPRISMGGGTRMARAIDYFRENYDQSAVMILISDFEDYLEEWHDREKDMRGYQMYGFNYGNKSSQSWTYFKERNFSNR